MIISRLKEKLLDLLQQTANAKMAERSRLINRANELLVDNDQTWQGVFRGFDSGEGGSWRGRPVDDIDEPLGAEVQQEMLIELLALKKLPKGSRAFFESLSEGFEAYGDLTLSQQASLVRNHTKFVKGK